MVNMHMPELMEGGCIVGGVVIWVLITLVDICTK